MIPRANPGTIYEVRPEGAGFCAVELQDGVETNQDGNYVSRSGAEERAAKLRNINLGRLYSDLVLPIPK